MQPVLIGKSSSVYFISFVIFAAGIWLILEFGSTLLHAREDLAGEWELTPAGSPAAAVQRMQIEQSGRYFNITLPNSKPMNLVLTDETVVDQHFGDHKRLTLTNREQTLQFEGISGGSVWKLTGTGSAANGQWTARIVERTYPRPTTPAAAVRAAASQPATQPQATGIHAQR